MKSLYMAYKAEAIIVVVYIREAHPANEDQTVETADWKKINDLVYYQPKTFRERRKLAETACTFWELPIPTLVDTMTPSVGDAYDSWPNRIYVIDKEGKIVYRGPKGPMGVKPREGEIALRKLLGKPDDKFVTPEDLKSPAMPGAKKGRPQPRR